jgi:hypothetical protein
LLTALLQLTIAHSTAHEGGNDSALVLVAEGLVEGFFDVIRDAEIDGCHRFSRLLNFLTIEILGYDWGWVNAD